MAGSLEHLASFPTFDFCQYWSRAVTVLALIFPWIPGHFDLHCVVTVSVLNFPLWSNHFVLHCVVIVSVLDFPLWSIHFEPHCVVILLEPALVMFPVACRGLVEPVQGCQVRELSDDVVALLLLLHLNGSSNVRRS